MRKKTVNIVKDSGGFIVRTRVGSSRFELTAKNDSKRYSSPESAKRAWRKFARANDVGNYAYVVEG